MLLQTGQKLFYAKTLYTSKHHASTKLKGETFDQDQAGMVGWGGGGAAGQKENRNRPIHAISHFYKRHRTESEPVCCHTRLTHCPLTKLCLHSCLLLLLFFFPLSLCGFKGKVPIVHLFHELTHAILVQLCGATACVCVCVRVCICVCVYV